MAFIGTPLDTRNTFQSLVGKRFNGDGSTTAFTLDVAPSSVLDIEVFVGNVRQDPNSAYTLSGTTLTFTGAPPSGTNNIYVVHQAKAVGTITPGANTVGVTELNLSDGSNGQFIKTDGSGTLSFGTVSSSGSYDLNGEELILDADADTSITADTDDQIDIKIAGSDDFQFTANTFTVASGSKIKGGGALTIDNASGDITIDSAGDILLDCDDTDIILKDGGSTFGGFKQVSGGCQINGGTDASLTLTSDGRGLSQFTAKVWANLNGNSFGLRDSHNISSATDNGSGDYTFTFSNNMANTNYAVVTGVYNGTSHSDFQGIDFMVNSVGNVRIGTCFVSATNSGASAHDVLGCQIAIFGD